MTPEEELEQRFADAKSLAEKQEIASEFIDKKYPNIDYKDILVKLCTELDELNNYFIKYIDKYPEGSTPSRNLIVALNNLYSSGVIDNHDLEGTGKNGKDSILFKIDLSSDNKSSSDIEFLVKSYVWLSQNSNIVRMNFDSILDFVNKKSYSGNAEEYTNISNICSQVLNPSETNKPTTQDMRSAILFKDANNSILRSKKDIEDILHAASSRVNTSDDTEDKVLKIVSDISKMSDDEKTKLFKQLGVKPE